MKRLIRAILIVIALGGLVVAGLANRGVAILKATADQKDNVAQEFIIQPDETLAEVSNNLREAGLIRWPLAFRMLANNRQAGPRIQANTYYFSPNMSMNQILNEMLKPPVGNFESRRFTVPEGLRIEEVAEIIDGTGIVSATDFLATVKNGAAFKGKYQFLADLPDDATLEGFLFPDTYDIFLTATVTETVEKMLDNFAAKYAEITPGGLAASYNIYEIVTMAAIIQREASNDEEMPRIGAAFWNRLKPEFDGNLIGADPTVQYVLGYSEAEKSWWRKELTEADLAIDSPYNTRINAGLPPGPIASPGLTALKGAANPAAEDITYFVAKCVAAGERPTHNFASDYTEFLRYQEEYLACPNR